MTAPEDIKWGSYLNYEGPYFTGTQRFQLPDNPSFADQVLAVITATEGGHYDAINMYDRMILSVGIIQWGEAGQYSVSDMLGRVYDASSTAFAPLQALLDAKGVAFKKNEKGRYRFFVGTDEVDTSSEQRTLFLLHSSGQKGTWDYDSKVHAKNWAAAVASVFEDPAAQRAQNTYTAEHLYGFVVQSAKSALFPYLLNPASKYALEGDEQKWYDVARAAFLSFAANLPAVAANHLQIYLSSAGQPQWNQCWVEGMLKELTFGPAIAIYPARYNAIRPVLEKLFGVNLPDFAAELQQVSAQSCQMAPTQFDLMTTRGVQQALLSLGFDLGPMGADGNDGTMTKAAVMSFQQAHGLTPDGVVGRLTRAALAAATCDA